MILKLLNKNQAQIETYNVLPYQQEESNHYPKIDNSISNLVMREHCFC